MLAPMEIIAMREGCLGCARNCHRDLITWFPYDSKTTKRYSHCNHFTARNEPVSAQKQKLNLHIGSLMLKTVLCVSLLKIKHLALEAVAQVVTSKHKK